MEHSRLSRYDPRAMRILLVEDEPHAAQMLAKGLREQAYAVDLAADGEAASEQAIASDYDAIILDVMLPKRSGFDVCRGLRADGCSAPILMLTARDAVEARIEGLDAGAVDYLPKPYDLDELLARLRALLRRSKPEEPGAVLRFADLTFDLGSMDARRGGRRFELTTTEAHLLELFMRNPRQVLPRSLIYERVWGYDFSHSSNALDVYVGYLRRKTEAEDEERLLHTVRGTGYVLREP
jgi:two-component system response regulator MprA